MGRILFVLTLLALGNAGCSTSQTAGERGYSEMGGKARLAPTEYIDGRQRNHMDDYLPKGMG